MPTLKDVAILAGVSPITVSRVINEPDTVKAATRLKVEKAMKALQYVPNAAAKNLAANRTGVIDIYIPRHLSLFNPFVMHLIVGVSEVLSEHMYSMLILRDKVFKRRCDGYIVTGLLRDEILDFYNYTRELERPVVLFGHTTIPEIPCVDVDNISGAQKIAEHLLNLGHRKIALINVNENKDYVTDRQDGWKKAFEAHGVSFPESSVFNASNSVEGGAQLIRNMNHPEQYTAFLCATDTIAAGVISELNRRGISIPQDVSVAGFDGLGHHLISSVPITTVQQPVTQVGKMLAEALINTLDGKPVPSQQMVDPNLLIGGSTAQCLL